MTEKLFTAIITAELIVIAVLGVRLYVGSGAVPTASVAPLSLDEIIFPREGELKYFFELRAPYLPLWLPYRPVVTINADTLNDRFDYSIIKPPRTFRIIALGDSWTYGQFVHTRDTYPEVLEDLLNRESRCESLTKFEVLNLGVPNYDIRYAVERFLRRGQKYNPDLVLWLLVRNDFDEMQEFLVPRTRQYLREFAGRGELDRETFERYQNAWNQSAALGAVWQRSVADQQHEYGIEHVRAYQAAALRTLGDSYRGPLILFTLPSVTGIEKVHTAIVEAFARERNGTYFYESPLDLKVVGARYPDGHPNPKGHHLIAQDLFEYLISQKLVPCV